MALAVHYDAGHLTYRISDKGKKFDVTTIRKGMGMNLMEFNADELDGEFEIKSCEEGTTVFLKLPV